MLEKKLAEHIRLYRDGIMKAQSEAERRATGPADSETNFYLGYSHALADALSWFNGYFDPTSPDDGGDDGPSITCALCDQRVPTPGVKPGQFAMLFGDHFRHIVMYWTSTGWSPTPGLNAPGDLPYIEVKPKGE